MTHLIVKIHYWLINWNNLIINKMSIQHFDKQAYLKIFHKILKIHFYQRNANNRVKMTKLLRRKRQKKSIKSYTSNLLYVSREKGNVWDNGTSKITSLKKWRGSAFYKKQQSIVNWIIYAWEREGHHAEVQKLFPINTHFEVDSFPS